MEYIKQKADDNGAQKSKIYRCVITCVECCLYCILKCVEFINKHAYIQVNKKNFNFFIQFFRLLLLEIASAVPHLMDLLLFSET